MNAKCSDYEEYFDMYILSYYAAVKWPVRDRNLSLPLCMLLRDHVPLL
jgi:hypothetical protein